MFCFECPAYQLVRTKYGSKLFSCFGVDMQSAIGGSFCFRVFAFKVAE